MTLLKRLDRQRLKHPYAGAAILSAVAAALLVLAFVLIALSELPAKALIGGGIVLFVVFFVWIVAVAWAGLRAVLPSDAHNRQAAQAARRD